MKLKNILDEDMVNYRKPCMFLSTCFCDWKCCTEIDADICMCQNTSAYDSRIVNKRNDAQVRRYMKNEISESIVFGGFEPMLQFDELVELIRCFREQTDDDIVIYSGYRESELHDKLEALKQFRNIIVKFGRYRPGQKPHMDEVLGVELANDEQYAKRIS
jgi:hypothetical protein